MKYINECFQDHHEFATMIYLAGRRLSVIESGFLGLWAEVRSIGRSSLAIHRRTYTILAATYCQPRYIYTGRETAL